MAYPPVFGVGAEDDPFTAEGRPMPPPTTTPSFGTSIANFFTGLVTAAAPVLQQVAVAWTAAELSGKKPGETAFKYVNGQMVSYTIPATGVPAGGVSVPLKDTSKDWLKWAIPLGIGALALILLLPRRK